MYAAPEFAVYHPAFLATALCCCPQLRVFCLTLGLYANGQAVNRAVRELREADILNRQTWIDSNSDLVLCRKYVYCFFTGKAREEVATPRRPNTMAPYILQARKIDWLLLIMEKNHLTTLESVEKYLLAHGCTVFLRLPDLLAYYEQCAPILAQVYPSRFQEQTEQLRAGMEQRSRLARGEPIAPLPALPPEPVATLEKRIAGACIFPASIRSRKRFVSLSLPVGKLRHRKLWIG